MQMNAEDEPQLGDLDSLLMSLNSSSDDAETICVDDLLVDEEGLPLALDEETRKARRMARNRRAAAESRDRKKRRVDELEGQVEVLERENSSLRSQLARAISGHDQDGPAMPSWWSGSGTTLRSSLLLLCLLLGPTTASASSPHTDSAGLHAAPPAARASPTQASTNSATNNKAAETPPPPSHQVGPSPPPSEPSEPAPSAAKESSAARDVSREVSPQPSPPPSAPASAPTSPRGDNRHAAKSATLVKEETMDVDVAAAEEADEHVGEEEEEEEVRGSLASLLASPLASPRAHTMKRGRQPPSVNVAATAAAAAAAVAATSPPGGTPRSAEELLAAPIKPEAVSFALLKNASADDVFIKPEPRGGTLSASESEADGWEAAGEEAGVPSPKRSRPDPDAVAADPDDDTDTDGESADAKFAAAPLRRSDEDTSIEPGTARYVMLTLRRLAAGGGLDLSEAELVRAGVGQAHAAHIGGAWLALGGPRLASPHLDTSKAAAGPQARHQPCERPPLTA